MPRFTRFINIAAWRPPERITHLPFWAWEGLFTLGIAASLATYMHYNGELLWMNLAMYAMMTQAGTQVYHDHFVFAKERKVNNWTERYQRFVPPHFLIMAIFMLAGSSIILDADKVSPYIVMTADNLLALEPETAEVITVGLGMVYMLAGWIIGTLRPIDLSIAWLMAPQIVYAAFVVVDRLLVRAFPRRIIFDYTAVVILCVALVMQFAIQNNLLKEFIALKDKLQGVNHEPSSDVD